MPRHREERVYVQCYPEGKSLAVRIAGFVLIAAGLIVILLCVPGWAWLAILGAALILVGILLAKK